MTSSPELLRFFHAEARECFALMQPLLKTERLFDANAFVGAARALRGSAMIARLARLADVALALEQVGSAVRDGELVWSSTLCDDMRFATSELSSLVDAAGSWSEAHTQRATAVVARLRHAAPNEERRPTPPASAASTAPVFIALQAAAIAADLEAFVGDPRNRSLLDDVSSRVRSLRGIAGVADHPPLGEVGDAVERTLRAHPPDALLRDLDTELLQAAAGVFRRASTDLRTSGRLNLSGGEIARFARAAATTRTPVDVGAIVRIDELYYSDPGPHVVERGQPSGSGAETRFRQDIVTRAEHLRRLVADARNAVDPVTRDRLDHELRAHLQRLEMIARSFNAQQVAAFFGEMARHGGSLDAELLGLVDAGAQAMLAPNASVQDMEQRLALIDRARHTPPSVAPLRTPTPAQSATPARSRTPVRSPTPMRSPTPAHPRVVSPTPAPAPEAVIASAPSAWPTPTFGVTPLPEPEALPRAPTPTVAPGASGSALQQMLQSSLAGLQSLDAEPLSEPISLETTEIVPVASLLYRGRAALDRAAEVRDDMRRRGTVDPESLQELYDLLDLARAE